MFLAVLLAAAPLVLSGTFPEEVPSGTAIANWDRYAGRVHHEGKRITYELFVDRRRLALYTITRYRVHRAGEAQADDEILIWNSNPGSRPREYLRCYARVAQVPGTLPAWSWQALVPETDVYRAAMYAAIQVYGLHRAREREQEEAAAR